MVGQDSRSAQILNAVLAAVSRASVNSQACRAERDYATKLGKPILPVAVEHMPAGLIPTDVARLQIIDYTGQMRLPPSGWPRRYFPCPSRKPCQIPSHRRPACPRHASPT